MGVRVLLLSHIFFSVFLLRCGERKCKCMIFFLSRIRLLILTELEMKRRKKKTILEFFSNAPLFFFFFFCGALKMAVAKPL